MKYLWYWISVFVLVMLGLIFGGFALLMFLAIINFVISKDAVERDVRRHNEQVLQRLPQSRLG